VINVTTLLHLLQKRSITDSLRVGVYKTLVRPIVSYGAELWNLKNKMKIVLMTWERKIIGKYMGQHIKMQGGSNMTGTICV
jgi:hypothetical protein